MSIVIILPVWAQLPLKRLDWAEWTVITDLQMNTGKHSHSWLSALSGIILVKLWEVSHEYKIQNGNMIHEEPPRGYRAYLNDPQIPLAAGLHCNAGRKMGWGDGKCFKGHNKWRKHTTQLHTTYIHPTYHTTAASAACNVSVAWGSLGSPTPYLWFNIQQQSALQCVWHPLICVKHIVLFLIPI